MKTVFIHHGEPDTSGVNAQGFTGQRRNFAPFTELGIQQAQTVSADPRLNGAQLIASSPYTRALQTAAILSKNTGLDITVEIDLHEFIPDKTFRLKGESENRALHEDFLQCRGEYPPGETCKWETITEIIARTKPVLDKYVDLGYEKIIVATHGSVIRRYSGKAGITHCEIFEMDNNKDFPCFG